MTDLEIIKHLENEINKYLGKNETSNIKYNTDNKNNIIKLDISRNHLPEIPKKVLKLKKLKHLNISNNEITNIDKLTDLPNLKILYADNTPIISTPKLIELQNQLDFLSNYGAGYYSDYFLTKDLLNHKLYLSTRHYRDDLPKQLCLEKFGFFPPEQMLELGYRNPQFYYKNYLQEYSEKYEKIFGTKYSFEKSKEIEIKKIKTDIISELLSRYYKEYKKTENLPYAIRKLSIYNYYEINELLIENIASNTETKKLKDPRWVFITGENGCGKTLLLQSIVIGLFGDKDGNNLLKQKGDFYLEFKNNDKYAINAIGSGENYTQFQHFAAYGPSRLIKNPKYLNESKTASLFNSYSELLDIENKLEKWKNEKQEHYLKSAEKILTDLLQPQIEEIVVKQEGVETYVRYIEKNTKAEKEFKELASGYRSIISMVGDIIIRLSKYQSEVSDFTQLAGIVLIDEIDLHLHPKWQKAMVEKLTKLFPKIQFIASTHSPIPILGAPENTVIINVQRTTEKGIIAKKLDVDFNTLLPNTLLSSPIFGFEEYLPKSLKDLSKLRTEDGYDEILFNKEVENRIDKMLEGGKND